LLDSYTVQYTILLALRKITEAFEGDMLNQIMPQASFSRRNIQRLDLEHRLLRARDHQDYYQYIWEIRVLAFEMVSQEPNYDQLFRNIDEDVREALVAHSTKISSVVFQEIGIVEVR
jgi:hypothetical protein